MFVLNEFSVRLEAVHVIPLRVDLLVAEKGGVHDSELSKKLSLKAHLTSHGQSVHYTPLILLIKGGQFPPPGGSI